MFISEYKAYDVERGLEFHLSGTIATRQEIREQIRQAILLDNQTDHSSERHTKTFNSGGSFTLCDFF